MKIHSVPYSRRCRAIQAGVGLMEVLIAVLILSIGILGVAALQAHALGTSNSAMARSMATVASYSVLDMMRADLLSAEAGAYDGTVTASSCPEASNSLASGQLHNWCLQLASALGPVESTKGTVDCSNLGICTITIQFDDSRSGAGGSATQKVVTKAAL